jgi:hypothetical protein
VLQINRFLFTYLSYINTPCNTVLLGKLTGCRLVKEFPKFYGTRKLITSYTISHHLSLSWTSSIQSIPTHHPSWRSISILPYHLRLGFRSVLFPSIIPHPAKLKFEKYIMHWHLFHFWYFSLLPKLLFVSLRITKQFPVHTPYNAQSIHLQPHTQISSTHTLKCTLHTFRATYTNFQYKHPTMHTQYIYSHMHQFPVQTPYNAHSILLQLHTPISVYFNHKYCYTFRQFIQILRTH